MRLSGNEMSYIYKLNLITILTGDKMDSFSRDLSTIVLSQKPADLKAMSDQMGREDFLKYIRNIDLFYNAITGIAGHTYLGACTFDFVTYDKHKARGIDPLGRMKNSRWEIPRKNKMSKDEWDRHRLVGEMIQIVECSQQIDDDSNLTHFVHEVHELSSAISGAFSAAHSWADRDTEPWEEALDTATRFFESSQRDIPELYSRTKSYFDLLAPQTQRNVTAWLGEVFYKKATTTGINQWKFSRNEDGKEVVDFSFTKLPDFNETVEEYCKRHKWEKPKKELRKDYFLDVGDKVLQGLGLQRKLHAIEDFSQEYVGGRKGLIERISSYLPF